MNIAGSSKKDIYGDLLAFPGVSWAVRPSSQSTASTPQMDKFNLLRFRGRRGYFRLRTNADSRVMPRRRSHPMLVHGLEPMHANQALTIAQFKEPKKGEEAEDLEEANFAGEAGALERAESSDELEDSEHTTRLETLCHEDLPEDMVPLLPRAWPDVRSRKLPATLMPALDSDDGIDPADLIGKYICLWPPVKAGRDRYIIEHNKYSSFYREYRQEPDPDNCSHRDVDTEEAGLRWLVFKVFDPDEDVEMLVHLLPRHAVESRAGRTIERPQQFVDYLCEETLRKLLVAEPQASISEGKIMIKIIDACFVVLDGDDDGNYVRMLGLQLKGMDVIGYIACGYDKILFDLMIAGTPPSLLTKSPRHFTFQSTDLTLEG
nr:hypothetical protein CFP56_38906 [Quercus suber]